MGFAPGRGVDPPDFHSADPLLALILGPPKKKKEKKKSYRTLQDPILTQSISKHPVPQMYI